MSPAPHRDARLRRRAATTLCALALGLGLTACTGADAGSSAAQRIKDHFSAAYGSRVAAVVTHHDTTLPHSGAVRALVRLHPSTPDDVVAQVERDLEHWDAGPDVRFTPVGVEANGVAICFGDPQRAQHRILRRLLHEGDLSLRGRWRCAETPAEQPVWSGTRAQLELDTRLVQSLSRTAPTPLSLELNARTTEPRGTAKGTWTAIDADAVHVVDRISTRDIESFTLTPPEVAITLEPVPEATRARLRADIRDHAPSYVRVRVYSAAAATGGPSDADRIRARAAALGVKGVESARYDGSPNRLVIAAPSTEVAIRAAQVVCDSTAFPRSVRAIVRTAASAGQPTGNVYDTAGVAQPRQLALFRSLVTMPDVTTEVTEGTGPSQVTVRLTLARGHVTGALRELKAALPDGALVTLRAPGNELVTLVVADEPDPRQVTAQGVDKTVFLAAWAAV